MWQLFAFITLLSRWRRLHRLDGMINYSKLLKKMRDERNWVNSWLKLTPYISIYCVYLHGMFLKFIVPHEDVRRLPKTVCSLIQIALSNRYQHFFSPPTWNGTSYFYVEHFNLTLALVETRLLCASSHIYSRWNTRKMLHRSEQCKVSGVFRDGFELQRCNVVIFASMLISISNLNPCCALERNLWPHHALALCIIQELFNHITWVGTSTVRFSRYFRRRCRYGECYAVSQKSNHLESWEITHHPARSTAPKQWSHISRIGSRWHFRISFVRRR